MARPQKNSIDYFSLDVVLDDKVELVDAKYGVQGFGILIRLWQKIYANSYYLEWNSNSLLLFKKSVNVDINLINDIINDCVLWQIFDEKLFNTYKILTSRGIQKRYIEATQRRKEVNFIEEFLLIDLLEKYQKSVNVNVNSVNVNINSKKDNINSQSKVKESKVKESKVKNREGDPLPAPSRFLKPTFEEVDFYCKERSNNINAQGFIDFYESKGWRVGNQPMKDWRAAVRTWETRNKPQKQNADDVFEKVRKKIEAEERINDQN